MFIGHFAPAFIAAAHPKATGLGSLFVAAQLVDFGFFAFVLLGIEHMRIVPGIAAMNPMDLHYMPYTHSLAGSAIWAGGFGLLMLMLTRSTTAASLAALVVLSHWFLDLAVHIPDLTIAGSNPRYGFGLWDHPSIAMPLELGLTFGALLFYVKKAPSRNLFSHWRVAILGIALLAVQLFNWFSPPPAAYDIGIPIVALVVFAVLAGVASWADVRRTPDEERPA